MVTPWARLKLPSPQERKKLPWQSKTITGCAPRVKQYTLSFLIATISKAADSLGLMSIDLTPCFETAAHAGDISKTVLEKVCCRAQTAVTMIAVNHHRLFFVRILNELLHIAVVQMQRSRNVRRLVRARIANIDEHRVFVIEPLFGLVNFYLWNFHLISSPNAVLLSRRTGTVHSVGIIRRSICRGYLSCYNPAP